MKASPASRVTHPRPRASLSRACLLGVLGIAVSGCSGDERAAGDIGAVAPPAVDADDGPPGESPPSDGAPASENPAGDNEPATDGDGTGPSSSEGQPVTDLAAPGADTDDPGAADPDGSDADSDPDPEATEPEPVGGEDDDGAVPSAGCDQARTLEDGTRTIVSGGMNRTYFLETPDNYDATVPHRVVFMFHWNYGSINAIVNPPDADRNTDRPFYGMGDLTDDRTIFVVPQGLISQTGGAGWQNLNGRDVVFTDDMLEAISNDLCIDESRVFTTGFSFGAAMSYQLACVRPDKFRAAVVYNAAALSGTNPATCTTPIAFFGSHGVDDPIINYQTGLGVLNVFAATNGCTAMTPPNPAQNAHTCVSFEGCSVPTRFCAFGQGQGNQFNTGLSGHYPAAKDPGESTSWIPREAWDFITQF
jgi:poly(3-hydroxybutyrate) depolymerase